MGFDKNLTKSERKNSSNRDLNNRIQYDRIPIYPSKVQSTAFPERVYIFAIQKFILISIILFLISVILGIAIYYKTFLFKPNPLFIYYSNYDKKFKLKKFYNPGNRSIYHNIQILAENFLKNWITNYYSIDFDDNVNKSKWGNCYDNTKDNLKENINNSDYSVCLESDRTVYNIFFEFVKPVLESRHKSGIVRIVKILKIEPFFYGLINHNKAEISILEEIALTSIASFKDSLYQRDEKIKPFRSYMFYITVDFMVVDFKNGKHINSEFFTSDNTVSLRLFQNESGHLGINKNWIKQFKILEHSTAFILHNKYKNIDITDINRKYNQMILESFVKQPINISDDATTKIKKINSKTVHNNEDSKSKNNSVVTTKITKSKSKKKKSKRTKVVLNKNQHLDKQ